MVAPVGRHLNGWCNQRGGGEKKSIRLRIWTWRSFAKRGGERRERGEVGGGREGGRGSRPSGGGNLQTAFCFRFPADARWPDTKRRIVIEGAFLSFSHFSHDSSEKRKGGTGKTQRGE